MTHPPVSLTHADVRDALVAVLDQAYPACAHVEYRLVGTGAALLHGVSLPAADVDLLFKQRPDLEAFGAALLDYRCLSAPAWLAETAQYYANYDVLGVEVGLSTVEHDTHLDFLETKGPGPWVHFSWLPCGPYRVPTVALELRLISELYRQRPDRYEPLLDFMRASGCDLALIRRGLPATGLSPELQASVLQRLGAAGMQTRTAPLVRQG